MVPSTFDLCVSATIFVRGPIIPSAAFMSSSSPAVSGTTRNVAPVRAAACCQGTRLLW